MGAREVFAARGYVYAGVPELAGTMNVSRSLVYHYFPGGRPELFVHAVEQLHDDLTAALRRSAQGQLSPWARLRHMLGGVFEFFGDDPAAYRLLFKEPFASGDPSVQSMALRLRVRVAAELATALGETNMPPGDVVAFSAGILGFALSNVELCLAGRIEPERALRVTCDLCLPPGAVS